MRLRLHQHHQHDRHHQLVRDRVEEFAEPRMLTESTRHPAIDEIRDRRDAEKDGGDRPRVRQWAVETYDNRRDRRDAKQGEQNGEVEFHVP